MKKILVFDNYDSFTYNLVHLIRELGYGSLTEVHRNDKISLQEVDKFDKILLSPGPGIPSEAGIMMELIKTYAPTKSIFGVCLGHQGIAEAFGARIYNMSLVLHGMVNQVHISDQDETLFYNVPAQFKIGHYHSWAVVEESVNGSLKITAVDENGQVMGLRHLKFDVRGVQFHPESILTEYGREIMLNWLKN